MLHTHTPELSASTLARQLIRNSCDRFGFVLMVASTILSYTHDYYSPETGGINNHRKQYNTIRFIEVWQTKAGFINNTIQT